MLEMQPLIKVSPEPFHLIGAADIQKTSRKDCRDAYLPLCGHLQAPDFNYGKE